VAWPPDSLPREAIMENHQALQVQVWSNQVTPKDTECLPEAGLVGTWQESSDP
jgi:hypothetical protein